MAYIVCASCGFFIDASKGRCPNCGAAFEAVVDDAGGSRDALKRAVQGSKVKFGRYEQGAGIEPIEWRVLERAGSRLLLISTYGLECRPYNVEQRDTTWEDCSLRAWLNGPFLDRAFTSGERAMIVQTRVPADSNDGYYTHAGNDTLDRAFILSSKEVRRFFGPAGHRAACQATGYAMAHGAIGGKRGNCYWWLRTPGYYQYDAAYVDSEGAVHAFGDYVNYLDSAVRPALWIDLEA